MSGEWRQTEAARLEQEEEKPAACILWVLTLGLPLQKFTVYIGCFGGCQSYHLGTVVA